MFQFFVDADRIGKDTISIIGEDVNHIKNVLRMKPGTRNLDPSGIVSLAL